MPTHRQFILFAAAVSLALPAASSAQSSTSERARELAQERADRAREQAQERIDREREKAQDRTDRTREKREAREERDRAGSLDTTVTFDARGTLNVTCPGGAVIVTGSPRNEIKVRARSESGAIRFTSNGTRATLEPSSGRGCSDGHFDVTVPAGTRVVATTWSGSVSVHGIHGALEAHAQSGDVDIRDAGSRLDVETLSGDVTVSAVAGESNIHTVSGGVTLSGARGDVEIETISGDIDLRDIIAKQIRAHTTSGEVSFTGQILDAGRYEFNTHSGEIALNLPGDIGAELTVSTFSGGIDSDFPITIKPGQHGIGASQAKRLSFTVGKGGARINAETFSGDITLKRRR